ncbi:MAG: CsbD family protein [Sphingomicrobium sp.]
MNDHDSNEDNAIGIDEDRTEGSIKQAGGKLKEGAGKLFGDEKLKRDGEADQGEGKLQNAWGSVKDEARETFGSDKDRGDNDRSDDEL